MKSTPITIPEVILFEPNGHGKYAAPDDETRHARFPLPCPLPQAGEGGKDSLREFHVKVIGDDRGFLFESFNQRQFEKAVGNGLINAEVFA